MFRLIANNASRAVPSLLRRSGTPNGAITPNVQFSHFNNHYLTSVLSKQLFPTNSTTNILQMNGAALALQQPIVRSVTKFSLNKAKRKTVKAVLKRFKRLDWGMWIRTHCGRHKKMFKKSPALKRRLRQHIFTNAAQSYLLDKMVTSVWRRPKHYIDDPYGPYHKRDEFFATKSKVFKV